MTTSTVGDAALTARPARMGRGPSRNRAEARAGVLLALPAIIGLVALFILPLIAAVVISFTDWSLLRDPEWIGVDNYVAMAQDPLILKSLGITFYYAIFSVPVSIVAALLIATLLNQNVRAHRLWVLLFYLPSILPLVAIVILFLWLLEPNFGIVNAALAQVGIEGPDWFGDPALVIPSFVLMNLWGAGGGALIFLAARRGIPMDLYEAARLDGASAFRQFRSITLPMLTPVIMFTLIIGITGALQTFAQGFLLGGSSQSNALFFNLYLYQNAFQNGRMGYASAMALLLFMVTLIITAVTFRSSTVWVFYESNRK